MPTTVTKTVKPGGGGDYTSLESWESSEQSNLVSADEIHVCECYSGGNLLGTPSNQFRLTGWITNATNHIVLKAADGHAHEGGPDTNKAYAKCTANSGTTDTTLSRPFWISEDIKIQNLQFIATSRNTSFGVLFPQAIFNLIEVDGCIIENDRPSAYTGTAVGVRIQNPIATKFYNNIIIMRPNSSSSNVYAMDGQQYGAGTAPTHEIYNNTIVFAEDCSRATGIRTQWPALDSENNYFYLDGTQQETIYNTALSGTITQGSNDKTDSDAAYSTATFASVTDGSEDFSLVTGSNLIDAGATLNSVTTDAVGTSRPAGTSYDVGAMELSTSTNYTASDTPVVGNSNLYINIALTMGIGKGTDNLTNPIKMGILHENNDWEGGYPLHTGFGLYDKLYAGDYVEMSQTGSGSPTTYGIFKVVATIDSPPMIMPQYNSENVVFYLDLQNDAFHTSNGTGAGLPITKISDAYDLEDLDKKDMVRSSSTNDLIETDAADSYIKKASMTEITTSEDATVFVHVKRRMTTNSRQVVLAGEYNKSKPTGPTAWFATSAGSYLRTSADSLTLSSEAITNDQIRVLKIDGTSITEYVNGTAQNTVTRTASLFFGSTLAAETSGGTYRSEIGTQINELIVFKELLSDEDIQTVEAGLAMKYGITSKFPSTHTAQTATAGSLYDSDPTYVGSVTFLTQTTQTVDMTLIDPDNPSNSKLNLTDESIMLSIIDCRQSPGNLGIELSIDDGHV